MKKLLFVLVIFSFVLFGGFNFISPPKINLETPPFKYAGYKTFPSPTTGFAPGYVFRIPKADKNQQVPVAILGSKKDYITNDKTLPSSKNNWKTSVLVYFMAGGLFNATANASKQKQVEISFPGAEIEEQLLDSKIDELLLKSNIKFKENNDYYIINQTIKCDEINYSITNYKDIDAKARNIIDTVKVNAKVAVKSSVDGRTEIVQAFKQTHRVLYTVLRVTPRGAQIGEGKKYVIQKPLENVLLTDYDIFRNQK